MSYVGMRSLPEFFLKYIYIYMPYIYIFICMHKCLKFNNEVLIKKPNGRNYIACPGANSVSRYNEGPNEGP